MLIKLSLNAVGIFSVPIRIKPWNYYAK